MKGDSPTRAVTFELDRAAFDDLKTRADGFGCSFSDLAKVYTLEGLARSGGTHHEIKPSGAAARWADRIVSMLADGSETTIKDLCAHLGTTPVTLRPVLNFMIAAGTLKTGHVNEHRGPGRAPITYKLGNATEIGTSEPTPSIAVARSNEEARELLGCTFDWPEGLLTHNDADPDDLRDP